MRRRTKNLKDSEMKRELARWHAWSWSPFGAWAGLRADALSSEQVNRACISTMKPEWPGIQSLLIYLSVSWSREHSNGWSVANRGIRVCGFHYWSSSCSSVFVATSILSFTACWAISSRPFLAILVVTITGYHWFLPCCSSVTGVYRSTC